MLTAEQKALRHGKIGASFIPSLMAGNADAIRREWMRLVEHPDYIEEDLSAEWLPMFGSYIEPFALDWHQRKTGRPLSRRQEWVVHPCGYIGATIDCFREDDASVIDCKAPGRWNALENVLGYYPGQLVVQKACTGAERAALLIVHGGDEPAEFEIIWDEDYEAAVWDRIGWFWACVENLEPPVAIGEIKAPRINAVRVVDMRGNNSWADFAAIWLENKAAKMCFDGAVKGIKSMLEDDVARAFGHGICASRSKAGSITIKESK